MKLISKTLILLSLTGCLEAKQIELLFNRTTQQEFIFNSPIDDQGLECPDCKDTNEHPLYCQHIVVENKGSQIAEGCLPLANQQRIYTLESLAEQIAGADSPVQALYVLWTQAVIPSEGDFDTYQDPLTILNFKGHCHKQTYIHHFLKLCSLLGIDTRPVTMHGKECYDFRYQGDWKLLDPVEQQFYFALDNQTLVSSEEVMDDPFLALRTKPNRRTGQIDLRQAWQQLAQFEILTPHLANEIPSVPFEGKIDQIYGFDLYPQEKLIYHMQDESKKLNASQYLVEHVMDAQERLKGSHLSYSSPFPIRKIANNTSHPLAIRNLEAVIEPGQTLTLTDDHLFALEIGSQDSGEGHIHVYSVCSKQIFPALSRGNNEIRLGMEQNPSSVQITYDVNEQLEQSLQCALKIVNKSTVFNHCTPFFELKNKKHLPIEEIWWQIAPNQDFTLIPSNFEQIEPFTHTVTLPAITDTFFNADDKYFFRVKCRVNGQWGEWSEPFAFVVKKPDPITSFEFNKLDENKYEISWEGDSKKNTEYLIFGSNSLDFIPSVYCETQVNAILDGEVIEEIANDNLQAITQETKYVVDGSLAYYRIIVKRNGQLSVPSPLIHVYDQDLIQARNVLQVVEAKDGHIIAKRTDFPQSYSWVDRSDLLPRVKKCARNLIDLQSFIMRHAHAGNIQPYVPSPHVSSEIWNHVRPFFLPENHPIKPKLDRLFSSTRVTRDPETFKLAGFKRNRPGRFSRVMASSNPKLEGVFIKAFADTELYIVADWNKWMHRIEGARSLQTYLARHNYHHAFKVPNKWIYPLPPEPSPPNDPKKYLRKNFILVAEDMRIYEHDKNEKYYKEKMGREMLNVLYTILQDEGLFDSVYAFNIPFCKDGKLAFIDTEYHHKWPVPFYKLTRYFSKDMQKYWEKLIDYKGPQNLPEIKHPSQYKPKVPNELKPYLNR